MAFVKFGIILVVLYFFADVAEVNAQGRGIWSDWGSWGGCSGGCDRGYKERSRACYGDRSFCGRHKHERKHCDCRGRGDDHGGRRDGDRGGHGGGYGGHRDDRPKYEYQSWGSWGACDSKCGYGRTYGRMFRRRGCRFGRCPDQYEEHKQCYEDCPHRPEFESWGSWGDCDAHCGYGRIQGRMSRRRGCRHGSCQGDYDEYKECHRECPEWDSWGSWGDCDASCGSGRIRGRMSRRRGCKYGRCEGGYDEYKECYRECPEWYVWGSWSECDARCGSGRVRGRMHRDRRCKYGSCQGGYDEYKDCYNDCPEWYAWGSWEGCDASCGGGYGRKTGRMQRRRRCKHEPCRGDYDEYQDCHTDCPEWDSWGSWGDCNLRCGYGRIRGRMSRRRGCKFGSCQGDYNEDKECYQNCAEWLVWGSWEDCDVNCGYGRTRGRMRRRRECRRGDRPGHIDCSGRHDEYKDCYHNCPEWAVWGSWEDCVYPPCGYDRKRGRMRRRRRCQYGSTCRGGGDEYKDCYHDCPRYQPRPYG